ncbi:hypothetical protein [Marmoricola sp. URHB0036]|uniref:hypothetical protein n=1 Tax=Marmoricola sp. URHB0036 TaxID=1298863 RepID=UPI0012DF9A13|nr:hypothetical protein [Marmoricola sp. URHB0036]
MRLTAYASNAESRSARAVDDDPPTGASLSEATTRRASSTWCHKNMGSPVCFGAAGSLATDIATTLSEAHDISGWRWSCPRR